MKSIASCSTGTGSTCWTAQDGAEGVDIYRENAERIGAVVVDMTMPKMNGTEVIETIRKESADIPMILMSGYNAGDSVNAQLRAELVVLSAKTI